MSGGEQTRYRISQAFSENAACILADEPTSHLDRDGVELLIQELEYFPGTLIIVSHDRYFLDSMVHKIWEINNHGIKECYGNYSDYKPSELISMLIQIGFEKDDIRKSLCQLSGGELTKLVLLKILSGEYNILLMDEPSTFLDTYAVNALESMMKGYEGTIIFVTHDNTLINNVADIIYEIKDRKINRIKG